MYCGYKEVTPSDFELNCFYSAPDVNTFDCNLNEYLMLKNNSDEVIDIYRWNGQEYKRLKFKDIDNEYCGRIHPRNPQQRMVFDMLQERQTKLKLIRGVYGSGRDIFAAV